MHKQHYRRSGESIKHNANLEDIGASGEACGASVDRGYQVIFSHRFASS
jgi:hypothetical protein